MDLTEPTRLWLSLTPKEKEFLKDLYTKNGKGDLNVLRRSYAGPPFSSHINFNRWLFFRYGISRTRENFKLPPPLSLFVHGICEGTIKESDLESWNLCDGGSTSKPEFENQERIDKPFLIESVLGMSCTSNKVDKKKTKMGLKRSHPAIDHEQEEKKKKRKILADSHFYSEADEVGCGTRGGGGATAGNVITQQKYKRSSGRRKRKFRGR
eukprot:TRINITY_DN11672_c0_g2_i1.p1 TRINITY_DN11672_c0_g2~~TRINITY_DN11672_c0_g2_i1.p1  ORF type:complete len:210 (-),score=45.72 TRINITY_DN11672_c0_g2_i1:418-1047(-)